MSRPPINASWDYWSQQQGRHPGYIMAAFDYPYEPLIVSPSPLVEPTLAPQYGGGYQCVSMAPWGVNFANNQAPYHYHQWEQPAQPFSIPHAQYSLQAEQSLLPSAAHHDDLNQQRSFSSQHLPVHDPRQLSPSIKSEASRTSSTPDHKKAKNITYNKAVPKEEVVFTTHIDIMMKALQGKHREHGADDSSSCANFLTKNSVVSAPSTPRSSAESTGSSIKGKRYRCSFDMCNKSFSRSTYRSTHERVHTGEKPFACGYPGCNRSFSQSGNLKTHRRLHTGERPFECPNCPSGFAHRSNLKAHMSTHNNCKPFVCKLEECMKGFKMRGSLKNHQNKYHTTAIQKIAHRIMSLSEDVSNLTTEEQELIAYFQDIYKNSNKGIKGRGRDRRVSERRLGKAKSAKYAYSSAFSVQVLGSEPYAVGYQT